MILWLRPPTQILSLNFIPLVQLRISWIIWCFTADTLTVPESHQFQLVKNLVSELIDILCGHSLAIRHDPSIGVYPLHQCQNYAAKLSQPGLIGTASTTTVQWYLHQYHCTVGLFRQWCTDYLLWQSGGSPRWRHGWPPDSLNSLIENTYCHYDCISRNRALGCRSAAPPPAQDFQDAGDNFGDHFSSTHLYFFISCSTQSRIQTWSPHPLYLRN